MSPVSHGYLKFCSFYVGGRLEGDTSKRAKLHCRLRTAEKTFRRLDGGVPMKFKPVYNCRTHKIPLRRARHNPHVTMLVLRTHMEMADMPLKRFINVCDEQHCQVPAMIAPRILSGRAVHRCNRAWSTKYWKMSVRRIELGATQDRC